MTTPGINEGVEVAPIAPPLEFPFPPQASSTSGNGGNDTPQRTDVTRNDESSSKRLEARQPSNMTMGRAERKHKRAALASRQTYAGGPSDREQRGKKAALRSSSWIDPAALRPNGHAGQERLPRRKTGVGHHGSAGQADNKNFSNIGPYPGFRFGNDHFRAHGKISNRDGRLGISVHDGNTGYLAKALGAGFEHLAKADHKPPPRVSTAEAHAAAPSASRATSFAARALGELPRHIPKLNIVVMVLGSRGDIQPFLKIGKVLKEDYGHRVRIATHPAFKEFVEKDTGLEFFSVGGDPAELMAFMVKNPGLIPSVAAVKAGEIGRKREQMYQMFKGFWRACVNATDEETDKHNRKMMGKAAPFVADAIIANPPSFAHIHCAERLGVPLHLMFTFPQTPTTEFPNPLAKIKKTNIDVRLTNFMSYPLVEMITWQGLGDLVNLFRVETLGLEPVSTLWAPGQLYRQKVPFTYMWSPGLVPKPADWGPEIDISGFVFLELASSFKPPQALVDFLDAGPEPIYIGFGSIVVDDPDRFTAIIFEAVKRAGVRALVSKGWGGLGSGDSPDGVFLLDNTPHDWIFPRVSAVIHHGGAGTTAIGLKCGKPTMVVPFFGDQPFWGSMIGRAGAGHEPVPYKDLSVDKLVEGIREILSPEAKANAQRLADDIAAEGDGAKNAVESFHRNLPLEGEHNMRCSILDDRVAVWKGRKTSLRLSALAARVLVQQRKISFKQLRLIRHCEWNDFTGPGEPVTGFGSAVVRSVSQVTKNVGGMPIKLAKGIKRHRTMRVERKAKTGSVNGTMESAPPNPRRLSAGSRSSSSSSLTSDSSLYSDESEDEAGGSDAEPRSRRSHEGDDENIAQDTIRDMGKSLEKSGEALASAPIDIALAIAQGLHNAPRLYGDTTVRRPTRITGLHSGLRAAGEEFVYGIYDGVTGLVVQPYRGAQEAGLVGLIKGVGKGIGGFVLKDLAAIIGPFGYTLKGVHKELRKGKTPTHRIRKAHVLQGVLEEKTLSPEQQRAVVDSVNQGWAVFLEMRAFINRKKAQGLKGRLEVRREEKRWREYGAFENVRRAKKALEVIKEAEENETVAGPPDAAGKNGVPLQSTAVNGGPVGYKG